MNKLFTFLIFLIFTNFLISSEIQNNYKIVYIGYSLEKPFWSDLSKQIKRHSQSHDLNIMDLTPPFMPFKKEQTQLMEYALEQKVDALILGISSPINHKKITEVLDKYQQENIPVILIDTNYNHLAVKAFITSDNLYGAKLAGNYIANILKTKKPSKVLIIGGEQKHPNSQLRIKGITEIFEKENIDYRVTYADWLPEKAYNISKKFLTKDNHFDAVFSCWDPGAIIAEGYWRTLNSDKKISFLGFDGLAQTIDLIKLGRIEATIAQNSSKMAEQAVLITKKILEGSTFQKETLIKPLLINQTTSRKSNFNE